MNSLKKTTICLLFLCIGVNCVFSEVPEQINFSYISINEGLSQSTVFSIDQDQRGNMWFATYDGVNKYDGYSFTVYQHNEEDPNSIANDISRIVKTDSQGRVWIGTRDGLSYYDEKKDKFRNFFYEKKGKKLQINGIAEISPEQLLISTQEGLTMFDIKESRFVDDFFSTAMHKIVASALYRQGDIIYIGTPVDGLYSYSIPQKKLEKITPITETKQIQAILQQSPTRIWIATEGTGLLLLNPKTKEVKAYHHSSSNPKSISSNYIRSLALDSQNRYFLVKAANSDGKWNAVPTMLEIIVLPVWYKTWWAIMLFLATFIGFITFVFRFFWMRKSMAAELELERRDKEHQEEINQMKMRFFINISHELRTPLTLILAPLQEIINKISDRWTRNQLEYIQRNANRLLHLVNQLMDYRRAELGVFELKVKQENAHQLIQDNFLFYDKLARHKKITYTLHSELEEKEELFDPNYLELIVNNLLSNAFKYTESGQSITVTLKEENNWLVLQVSDTGIGIPINKQGKIFERFYQIESEHVGSGIGLSLVQRLVELHHGRIELDSEEGKGSTFSVYLPQDINIYKPSELASNDAKNEEDQVYSTNSKEMYFIDTEKVENEAIETGDKKRGTILIVEDNNEIRHYLSSGLAELFNTLEAGNGEEALEKLKENEVDIIVTDVMMPVMDGIKLCKNVKQNIRTCHIPVIILSAKSETKDQMEGLQMGADDYIPKPFSLAILTTKIQNMMRTRRRMLERYSKSLEVEPEKITFNAMDEALLKRAVAIVEKNMDNIEFSTDEFAREMNMSRSNLHLKLKAITGESTIDFIRKIRFNEAAKLLKDGRYTVAEVSTMVGFNTPSYFATSFKKYFGCLPTEYIKKAKG